MEGCSVNPSTKNKVQLAISKIHDDNFYMFVQSDISKCSVWIMHLDPHAIIELGLVNLFSYYNFVGNLHSNYKSGLSCTWF